MTIARACRPPAQGLCRRLAGRWWIAQYPPRSGDALPNTTNRPGRRFSSTSTRRVGKRSGLRWASSMTIVSPVSRRASIGSASRAWSR